MTLAFEKFMKQYEMTGSEKADGYSRDALTGLDNHEKETVFQLLIKELPWSVEWLFFLDPVRALDAVKKEEERLRGDPYKHVYMLQQQIVKKSGDLLYQKRMIEDYPNYIESLKPLVVDAVGNTPTNALVLEFLKQLVLVETNPSAVARASRHLLNAVKLPRSNELEEKKFSRLMDELRSDNTQAKRRAIREVEKYEQRLFIDNV